MTWQVHISLGPWIKHNNLNFNNFLKNKLVLQAIPTWENPEIIFMKTSITE
jgi:hypothetical protein